MESKDITPTQEEPSLDELADQMLPLFKRMFHEIKNEEDENQEEGSESENSSEAEEEDDYREYALTMTLDEQKSSLSEAFKGLTVPKIEKGQFLKMTEYASQMLDLEDAMFATEVCLVIDVHPLRMVQNDEDSCTIFDLSIAFLKDHCWMECYASSQWFESGELSTDSYEMDRILNAKKSIETKSHLDVGMFVSWKTNGKFKSHPDMNQPMIIIDKLSEPQFLKSESISMSSIKVDLLVAYFVQISEEESTLETCLVHSSRVQPFK